MIRVKHVDINIDSVYKNLQYEINTPGKVAEKLGQFEKLGKVPLKNEIVAYLFI